MVPLRPLLGGFAIAAITILTSVVAVPSGALASSYNYLTNGNFETGDLTGWTPGGNFEYTGVVGAGFGNIPKAEDGSRFLAAGPVGSDGSLSQTFSDTAGQLLNVSGWYYAFGDNPSDLSVLFDGKSYFSISNPNSNGAWQNLSFDVTATGSDTLALSFMDNVYWQPGKDGGWISLDNFSVTDPPTTTPLPAALPLFASGFAMMSLLGWRRKRKNTAARASCLRR
jgi:hypothetical protein